MWMLVVLLPVGRGGVSVRWEGRRWGGLDGEGEDRVDGWYGGVVGCCGELGEVCNTYLVMDDVGGRSVAKVRDA